LKIRARITAITTERDEPEPHHAALEVVVDLLQVHRRAGDGEVEPVELHVVEEGQHRFGGRRLLVEARVAAQHHAAHRGLRVGERGCERLADRTVGVGRRDDRAVDHLEPVVAVDQELVPREVADLPVGLVDRVAAGEAEGGVGGACLGAGLVAGGCPQERLAARADAVLVAGQPADEGVAERERHERRDHRLHAVDVAEPLGDVGQRAQVLVDEQVGDVDAVVGRTEEHDDGLAAELALELPIVDRRLRIGVQVAVLPRREFHPRHAGAEHHRDRGDDDRHPRPPLPQRDGQTPPEPFHGRDCTHRRHTTTEGGKSRSRVTLRAHGRGRPSR
jgi:hypothetical protein